MQDNETKSASLFLDRFDSLLSDIRTINWKSELAKCSKDHQIKCYKIQWLSPAKIRELYENIVQRYYTGLVVAEEGWHENELRVFAWTILTWSKAIGTRPDSFEFKHWKRLSECFNNKPVDLLEYQYQNIKKICIRNDKWSNEQDQVMKSIVTTDDGKISWNEVAKDIFFKTSKKIFRSPKQCRERWNNYLDPSKDHGEWTPEEDRSLFNQVAKLGKRWALIGKHLDNKRTEHMVKNRFNSLICRFKKTNSQLKQLPEAKLISLLTKELNEQQIPIEVPQKEPEQIIVQVVKEPKQLASSPKESNLSKETKQHSKQLKPSKEDKKNKEELKCESYESNSSKYLPLPFLRNFSKQSEDIQSPKMNVTPGNANFFVAMTPFLISPPVNSSFPISNDKDNFNYFGFDCFKATRN